MKLYVDSREPRSLLDLLNSRINNIKIGNNMKNKNKNNMEICNLDIGDFIIKNNNDETKMIFERKTIADLISSIKDGRYNEQSYRLSQFPLNNHHIFYVIEGNLLDFISKNTETMRKMLFSAMFSLSYKKGFSLLYTNGWLDTAEFIIRFMDKLGTIEGTPESSHSNLTTQELPLPIGINLSTELVVPLPQYSNVIKTTKKSNITKNNIGEIMLAQIPGVSINAAQSLMLEYKTIKNLMNMLDDNSECLNNFQIPCKNGSRKISKSTIQSLKEYL